MNFKDIVLEEFAFIDRVNTIAGTITAIFAYLFGKHWTLFAAFLFLNVADWITGWMKGRITGKETSKKTPIGLMKKLGYWLMIAVSFGSAAVFMEIGVTLGIDLGVTSLLGWFVLASLIVNEIRSILENFVEAGFDVPKVLVKGLEVADKMVNQEDKDE